MKASTQNNVTKSAKAPAAKAPETIVNVPAKASTAPAPAPVAPEPRLPVCRLVPGGSIILRLEGVSYLTMSWGAVIPVFRCRTTSGENCELGAAGSIRDAMQAVDIGTWFNLTRQDDIVSGEVVRQAWSVTLAKCQVSRYIKTNEQREEFDDSEPFG